MPRMVRFMIPFGVRGKCGPVLCAPRFLRFLYFLRVTSFFPVMTMCLQLMMWTSSPFFAFFAATVAMRPRMWFFAFMIMLSDDLQGFLCVFEELFYTEGLPGFVDCFLC